MFFCKLLAKKKKCNLWQSASELCKECWYLQQGKYGSTTYYISTGYLTI